MANSKRKKTSGYFVTVGTGEKIRYNSNPTRSKPKATEAQKQAAEARVQQYRSAAKENASTQSGLSKPAKITSDVSGEAWTRATPSQTTLTQDQQKKHTEIQLKTYQTQLDQANRDAYDWGIREEQEFLGGFVPQDVLDRTNKSKYKSSSEAKQAAQVLGQQKTSLLNQNYENRSQDILKTVNADKNASSALKTAQGLEGLQRKIRYELEWSSAEGIDRSSAETRKLGLQYGLTEAECKNIWSMQAAITKKLKQAKAAVEKTGISYDDAYEYLRRQELSKEAASKKTALEKELDDNGLEMTKHTGLSVLANMGKGVDYVAGIAGNWGHNDERNLDTYRPMNSDAMSATNYVNTVRGKVGSEIQEGATAGLKKLGASEGVAQFGGEASKFLYDTGMSIVDNAAQMAVAGVAGAGTAGTSAIVSGLMGTGAAADQMKNILDNGGTNDQAMVGGFAAGVAEALFEKVSIDALLTPKNITNFKSWAKEALKQGGVEASEEVCTELANMFTDALIRGQDSDFQRAIAYYQTEEGGKLSLTEAKKKAYLDAIGQVALAGLGGFISGGVMQGVKGGVGLGNYNSALKKVGQAVKDSTGNTQNTSHIAEIQKGLAAAEGSKARQLAEQAQKELDSKKTVSNKLLGKLAVENQNELRDAMKEASPEAAAKAMTELSSTGNVSTATMAELRASAKVSPAASAEVQQTEAQAQVTQAENPGVNVLDAATTLFTRQGMLLKTAQKKAQIVQDLIDGKDVGVDRIKELEPTNPKARALFTQLTGVQFPDGKVTQEQLYNLYRSAHDVAVQAQLESVAIDSAEGRETFPGINRVLDNSGQETPVNQMSEEQILEQAKTVRETANPEADARAAQALAQMRGEIAPDGNALLSFKEFSDFIKQQNPKATREETARLYDQYLKDNQTVEFRGQRLSHMQFMDMVRHAPRGSELTEAEAESLWAAEVDRQRGAGEEKYSVSESQRTKESEMNAAAEQARRAENAATAKWMQDVLKPLGVQQVIVEYGTMGDNENAYIDSDGILHFNGDRMSGANAMIWTLGHELVHHAEFRTGETGNVSEDIIDAFSKLNKAGALSGVAKTWMDNVDGRVSEIKKTYQNHEASLENGDPDKVTDAYCREELAGDLMRIAFTEDNLLMRLAGEKPSLLIRSKEALSRLKAQMFGNEQIRATVDARKALDEMEKRFEKALKISDARAIRNEPGAFTDSDGNLIVENDGKGSSRLSLSTYEESGKEILRTWLDDAVDNKQLSREDADDILKSLDTIYQVCKGYKDQYAPFSAWSDAKVVTDSNGNPVFSVVKANGDYSMNLDFSLVCKKRRTLDAVLNEMVRRGLADNVNMGQENIVRINDIIRKYGFEAACSLCFVDAKRFRQAKVADDFVKMYNDQVNSLIPKGSDLKASYFNFGGNSLIDNTGRGIESLSDTDLDFTKVDKILKTKGERTVEYKIAKHLKENAADRRLCARSDFLSTRGFNVVKKENPAVLSLFNSKKGSGGPKSAESDVQYLNEILASKTFDPEKAYAVGGVRIQSFSDFVPRMVFDYVQMFADMSAKQLPGHAYTKEELFVKMFGLTGLKINMSLIPKVVDGGVAAGLDADGNYVWADESFDYDTALEIQEADGYSKNCGTIAVGVSDEHIRKLLADPNIRMVIPYHKSGLNPEVARMNKIDQFTDYTDSQNTRHKNGNKLDKDNAADKKLLAEETNFNQRLHEMGENGDPRAVVEEYVKWCEDNDLLPKFDQFVYKKIGDMFVEEDGHKVVDENYYKLIEDFTVYDGGAYSPQTAVKMTFPTEDSAFGPMSELIKRGLEEDAILEGKRSEKVGPIVDEIAQAMHTDEWKNAAKESGKKRSRKRYSVEAENESTDDSGMAFYDTEKKYSVLVEDKDTLDFLNNQKTIKTYKTMQLVDGKLYPPMASRINGKFEDASELGKWEQATEHPELIKNGNKFKLDKGKGNGSIEAAYNPYMHSSNLVINDQFTGAYTRDNLVTVECEVPVSEVTSGYHAEYAKDSVGWHSWHTGTVAGQIRKEKGIERQVFLSRWIKPVRIVPDSEVASMYKTLLDGTDIAVPDNVVTPSLRDELKKAGVKLQESGKVKYSITEYTDEQKREHDAAALKYFGNTDNWKETGYLTLDGKKLDFSGRHDGAPGGYRTVDHRDVSEALGLDYGGGDYSGAMVQFMAEGNIRISPESNGINLSVLPTEAQERALEGYISRARGEVILDIDDTQGNTISSTEYPKGTRASKVLSDIRQYFKDGTEPYVPNTARYRYSITGENDAMENEKAIRKLENEIEDINSKLDLASVDGLSEIEVRRLQNQLTKSQYELDQRNAAERKAAVRTPLQTVLDNLDNYRAIDLESIANQLTDNAWDDVETLSVEELKSGIREIIQERAGDMSPLEMQSPKFGVYVRKPSTSAGVRYSITQDSTGRELTKEQQEFFKDSKAVDRNGNLRVLYHGTGSDFTVFDRGRIEQNFQNTGGDLGFYFTPYRNDAKSYAKNATGYTGDGRIVEVYLNLKNPLIVEDDGWGSAVSQADNRHNDLMRWAKAGNHDGIIVKSTDEIMEDDEADAVYIAFYPEQIKNVANQMPTNSADIRYSITPEFEQWYKENFGGEDLTDAQLQRRLEYAKQKEADVKSSQQAAKTKQDVDQRYKDLTAWMMYHERKMREQRQTLKDRSKAVQQSLKADKKDALQKQAEIHKAELAVARDEKVKALKDKDLAWRIYSQQQTRNAAADKAEALKTARKEANAEKAEAVRTTKEVERAKAEVQHDADMMAMKREAAKRLRIKEDAYQQKGEQRKENQKLKRNAAKQALRDSKLAAKKRAEAEVKQGAVDTIRKNPASRSAVEKLQERASQLRTLGRSAYRTFVNQALHIDELAKRQVEGTRASTLVTVLGGANDTVSTIYKNGLVDRAGNTIGESMKDVFLCWDVKGRKVDQNKQALLQDYMLHQHNVDRMSFVDRARTRLETFEQENPWLSQMDTKEFARLVAMTDAEIQSTGKQEAHDKAVQYARLLHEYDTAQNKPIFGDSDGNAVTADTSRKIVQQYLSENPWLEEKAQGIYDWWDKFMRTWAVGDSITETEYNTMRELYPHYVPTYRADKKGVGAANFVGANGASIGKAVKKAKGGMSEVLNIEDSFSNLVSKIVRLERTNELYMNMIDSAMLDNDDTFSDMIVFDWDWQDSQYGKTLEIGAILNGDLDARYDDADAAGLSKVGQDRKLTAWHNGRQYSAYISEDLFKSIANVTGTVANDIEKAFIKAGNALTGPMKTAITGINPFFAVRNLSRDLPTAITNSISGMAFPKYWAQAAAEIAKNSENWKHFQALGGTNATYYNDQNGFVNGMEKGDGIASKIVGKMGAFNEVTEAQTRFAEYLATIDRLGDTYENRLLGIKNAAEVTVDFSRKGRAGKLINAWVPYWNPAVQGVDKVVRSVIDSPDGSAVWKQAARTVGRASMTTVLLEAILYAVLKGIGRYDDWEELDDRTKDTYYCIPYGKSNTFIKVPKNREWGAILGTPFMRLLEYANGRENPFENYIETSLEPNFLPGQLLAPREGGGWQSDIIGVSQALDLQANKDFAGRTIVPYSLEKGSKELQYNEDTSWFAKQLGALIHFSPMQIDYIITDYFGNFGDIAVMATSDAIINGTESMPEKLEDVVKNQFVVDNRKSNYVVSKYYDTLEQLDTVVQDRLNQLGADAYKDTVEYQTKTALDKLFGKQISELNKQAREAKTDDERMELKGQIAELAEQALSYYDDCMSGKIQNPVLDAQYASLPSTVAKELERLDGYSTDYRFKPAGTPSKTYTDPKNKNKEYVLTDEQKDKFKDIYQEQYAQTFSKVIGSSKYKSASDEKKANLLENARDDVLEDTKDEFFKWLKKTGAKSTAKKK